MTAFKPRVITKQDVDFAFEMFTLGFELCREEESKEVEYIRLKRDIILSAVDNDPVMADFLEELFECGKNLGARKRRKDNELT